MLERTGIIAPEVPVVVIMPVRATPERDNATQTPRKVIARVSIDGLELTQRDPSQDRHKMHIIPQQTKHQGGTDGTKPQKQRLPGTSILSSQAEGGSILVVDTVDGAVERPPVHGAVQPVVVSILDEEEGDDLGGEGAEVREGDGEAEAAEFHHGVEEDDEGHFDDEVDEEDVFGAGPLLGGGGGGLLVLDLVFHEDAGEGVGDDPGEAAAEVDDFVEEEGDDSWGC